MARWTTNKRQKAFVIDLCYVIVDGVYQFNGAWEETIIEPSGSLLFFIYVYLAYNTFLDKWTC